MHADEGMVWVKLFLHISSDEQLRRFEKRAADPLKAWKLTDDDWRNRARRADYVIALEEAFARTSTTVAPWHVVPADSKRYARVEATRLTVEAYEESLRAAGMPIPELA
jgi:polyphosphate kinase 2 (PPK2 family)